MNYQSQSFEPPKLSWAVKRILIVMWSVFLVQLIASRMLGISIIPFFGFSPAEFLNGKIWQPLTYIFLHDDTSPMHIFFNSLVLFFIGPALELRWGWKKFLKYFLITGAGSLVLHMLFYGVATFFLSPVNVAQASIPVIGASGAIYGLLMAFGMVYANATVLFMFVVPMKARTLIQLMVAFTVFLALFFSDGGVAHLVHLGGFLIGYIYLKWKGGNLDGRGGGGFLRRKRRMSSDEVRQRLSIVADNKDVDNKGKYPITWN